MCRYFITNLCFCRFDGKDFLERLRGKSIMFVGDSLSRNQWQSLTCLLHSAVPNSKYSISRVDDVSTFEFTVSHFSCTICLSHRNYCTISYMILDFIYIYITITNCTINLLVEACILLSQFCFAFCFYLMP